MGLVPEILDKYFQTKSGKTKKNGFYFTELNKYLREQMGFGVKKDIGRLRIKGRENPLFISINEENINLALSLSCWGKLKDDERARTLYLYINHHMKTNYPKLEVPTLNLIPSREHQNFTAEALFCEKQGVRKSFVYIRPDILVKCSGINLANYIGHELQHCHDFNEIKTKTLEELAQKYTKLKNINYTSITELPLSGEIFNYKTNKSEKITPELREKILTVKSYLAPIHIESKVYSSKKVKNTKDMFRYLQCIAYQRSPLEMRAFKKGAETASKIVEKNNKFGAYSDLDNQFVQDLKNENLAMLEEIKTAEKVTGLRSYEICDLFTKLTYYSNNAHISQALKQKYDETKAKTNQIVTTSFNNLSFSKEM